MCTMIGKQNKQQQQQQISPKTKAKNPLTWCSLPRGLWNLIRSVSSTKEVSRLDYQTGVVFGCKLQTPVAHRFVFFSCKSRICLTTPPRHPTQAFSGATFRSSLLSIRRQLLPLGTCLQSRQEEAERTRNKGDSSTQWLQFRSHWPGFSHSS